MKKILMTIILCMIGICVYSQQYTYVTAPKKVTNVYKHCDKYQYDTIVIRTEWMMVSMNYDRKGTTLTEKMYFQYDLKNGHHQIIPIIAYPYDAGEIQSVEYVLAIAKKKPKSKKYIVAYIKQ